MNTRITTTRNVQPCNCMNVILLVFLLNFLHLDFVKAQDEFELLYGMEEGFSLNAQNQLVTQWAAHATSVSKNTNCINQIEGELKTALLKNAAGLSLGIPYQAQVNYSACKLERMIIDTLSKESLTPHLIKYHISGCFDPNKSLSKSTTQNLSYDDVPLLVTYLSTDQSSPGWKAFDHYGYTGPMSTEEQAITDLFYKPSGLKFLCQESGYNVYQINNATKHSAVINVVENLKSRGVDITSCINSTKNPGFFTGRYQMLIEKYYDLEIRYILIQNNDGTNKILVRFTNKNPEFMAQARISKGIAGKTPGQQPTVYEILPTRTLTVKLNEIVDLEYNFTMPPSFEKENQTISDKLIEMTKQFIRKQVTVDKNKMKIEKLVANGIRG
jgi:hypothetical protein